MFSLFRGLLLLAVCFVAIGLFRGWFSFTNSTPDPQDKRVNISVSVDRSRLAADVDRVERKVVEKLSQRIQERSAGTTSQQLK